MAVINKVRLIQGWNTLKPQEAEPVAFTWIEQLDRFQVPPHLYVKLLDLAIDARLTYLKNGREVPGLTVELFIAMYENHYGGKKVDFSFCGKCDADGLKIVTIDGKSKTVKCKHAAVVKQAA